MTAVEHRVQGGVRFSDDGVGRGYWVRCACGWESELGATPALAEAAGEQHLVIQDVRRPPAPSH